MGCSGVYAWWHDGRFPIDLPPLLAWQKTPEVVEAAKPQQIAAPPDQASASSIETVAPPAAQATPEGSKFLLDLIAIEKTWLSVSSDGKPVFSGVLAPKQTKTIAGKQFTKVRVGIAAGLEVRLNGKDLGPLGARGQVLVVLFTPDNFQIVSHAKEGD